MSTHIEEAYETNGKSKTFHHHFDWTVTRHCYTQVSITRIWALTREITAKTLNRIPLIQIQVAKAYTTLLLGLRDQLNKTHSNWHGQRWQQHFSSDQADWGMAQQKGDWWDPATLIDRLFNNPTTHIHLLTHWGTPHIRELTDSILKNPLCHDR